MTGKPVEASVTVPLILGLGANATFFVVVLTANNDSGSAIGNEPCCCNIDSYCTRSKVGYRIDAGSIGKNGARAFTTTEAPAMGARVAELVTVPVRVPKDAAATLMVKSAEFPYVCAVHGPGGQYTIRF